MRRDFLKMCGMVGLTLACPGGAGAIRRPPPQRSWEDIGPLRPRGGGRGAPDEMCECFVSSSVGEADGDALCISALNILTI